MNLFVIEFASENVEVILRYARFLIGENQAEIQVLPIDDIMSLNFINWNLCLESAFSDLESRKLSAIQILTNDDTLLLATIYQPKFMKNGINEYSCVAEIRGYLAQVEKKVDDINSTVLGSTYLSVSLEESLDIYENSFFEPEAFPWDDWRLVLGSCANQKLRRGAAFNRLLGQRDE